MTRCPPTATGEPRPCWARSESKGGIPSASQVYTGAPDAVVFLTYVRQRLAPSLRREDIVVMDNLSAHKVRGVRETIEAVDAQVWYWPLYSPHLNPIQKRWSKVKAILRSIAARTFDPLIDAIATVLQAVTASDLSGDYQSCGYPSQSK